VYVTCTCVQKDLPKSVETNYDYGNREMTKIFKITKVTG